MESIPLPSHIHYELLLQLLERQTVAVIGQDPHLRDQLHELIVTLRKARTQQKQLEENCQRAGISVEYHWSLNTQTVPEITSSEC
ncbi:MAG: DUF5340 domain-containing protein [Synechococcales cyanobacterium T60_A2020_003]|nr:DUF5340 domain-containing protein [Synechococcales cyanobacterium T60_A2020_003]